MAIFAEVTENECINEGHPFVRDIRPNLIDTEYDNWKTVPDKMQISIIL